MSKPTPQRDIVTDVARTLNAFGRHHRIDQVFSDWVEMSALALARLDQAQFGAREKRYMAIVSRYTPQEAGMLSEMFGRFVLQVNNESSPFADLISKLELESPAVRKRLGQFHTPFHVSYMMAKMALAPADKLTEEIQEKGYITMCEPACGAGGMVVAFTKALQDAGINYQTQLHVTAVDIDPLCVHMTYVLAGLLGIPGIVYRGNSLHAEPMAETWYTPFHILRGWGGRLQADAARPKLAIELARSDLAEGQLTEMHVFQPASVETEPVASPVAVATPASILASITDNPAVEPPGITKWHIVHGIGSSLP